MLGLADRRNIIKMNWVLARASFDITEPTWLWLQEATNPKGTSMRQMNQGQLWHDKQDHQWKTSICQWQANNIPKMALSKSSSLQAKIQQVLKNTRWKEENTYVQNSRVTLNHLIKQKRNLKENTNLGNYYQNTLHQYV